MKKLSLILIVTIALFAQPVTGQRPFGAPSNLQLVEASVPELQLALRSRLITSEQLVQMYLNRVPPNDAFITEKLREAGAIILGKATLTEFANFIAIGMPSGYSSLGGYGFNASTHDHCRQVMVVLC